MHDITRYKWNRVKTHMNTMNAKMEDGEFLSAKNYAENVRHLLITLIDSLEQEQEREKAS